MLDVAYLAVDDLPPGRLADITEDRGRIRVRLEQYAPLADVVRQLNIEVDQLMASSRWFQMWKDEIVCRDTPNCPLRVEYVLDPKEPKGVLIRERRGLVRVHIDPTLTTKAFAAVMSTSTRRFLDAGQWFQLYAGEIIDNSPEPMSQV